MEIFDVIKARCSVREYTGKAIPKDVITKIVDCARLAPTARKEEPWEFIAVTDKEALKKIADITDYGKFIQHSACTIAVCSRDTKYYLEDCSAATENILLAATAFGIGSCWVAGDKKAYCQKILDMLKMPTGYRLVSLIALGYLTKMPEPLKKRTVEDVLHWERF